MAKTINRDCECWEETVSLNFMGRDFPGDSIRHIYCPRCSRGIRKNATCMVEQNGWLIEYDPISLRPRNGTVHIVENHKVKGSFLIYVE